MNNLYRIFMLEATEKLTCTSFSIFLAQKKELFFPFPLQATQWSGWFRGENKPVNVYNAFSIHLSSSRGL